MLKSAICAIMICFLYVYSVDNSLSFVLQTVVQPQLEQLLLSANTSSSLICSENVFRQNDCTTTHITMSPTIPPIPIKYVPIIVFFIAFIFFNSFNFF